MSPPPTDASQERNLLQPSRHPYVYAVRAGSRCFFSGRDEEPPCSGQRRACVDSFCFRCRDRTPRLAKKNVAESAHARAYMHGSFANWRRVKRRASRDAEKQLDREGGREPPGKLLAFTPACRLACQHAGFCRSSAPMPPATFPPSIHINTQETFLSLFLSSSSFYSRTRVSRAVVFGIRRTVVTCRGKRQ